MTEYLKAFNEILGVENPCPRCGGLGRYTYASTATWRGGCAGMTATVDICDQCWGSGDATRKWLDLRLVSGLIDSHRELLDMAGPLVDADPRASQRSKRIVDHACDVQRAWRRR
jgi:hypothetical protein